MACQINQIKSLFAQMRQARKLTITVTMSRTAQEALTAALVNNSRINTRTASVHVETLHCITKHCKIQQIQHCSYSTVKKELKSVLCSERRKRPSEPKSTLSVGKLFHTLTIRQAKKSSSNNWYRTTVIYIQFIRIRLPRVKDTVLRTKKLAHSMLTMLKMIL